jgi:hypothetical protein
MITTLKRRYRSLRKQMDEIGVRLDRLVIKGARSSAGYIKLDAEADRVFDELCLAEDAVLTHPVKTRSDIVAKLAIVYERSMRGIEVSDLVRTLGVQVRIAPPEFP